MTIPIILLTLAALYLIFIAGPAVVAYKTIFPRRAGTDFEHGVAPEGQFAPYGEILRQGRDELRARKHREVSVRSEEGYRLAADYYDAGSACTAVLLHGYRSDPMLNFAVQGACFARRGYNLLQVYHRAHGPSEGEKTALGLKEQEDLMIWLRWLLQDTETKKIVLYGISMGASTAAYAADRLDPATVKAMVLDCGFTSPDSQISEDCVKRHLPAFLLMPVIRLLAKHRMGIDLRHSVKTPLSRTSVPAFFLHGTEDRTVPYDEGRRNYEACASKKYFYTAQGAGHTAAFLWDPQLAEKTLFAFLRDLDPALDMPGAPSDPVN